jgi:hypothetical protein
MQCDEVSSPQPEPLAAWNGRSDGENSNAEVAFGAPGRLDSPSARELRCAVCCIKYPDYLQSGLELGSRECVTTESIQVTHW